MICGDALEVLRALPNDSVDAVITDPPYCSGGRSISAKQQGTGRKYEKNQYERPDFVGDAKKGPGSRAPHKGYFRHQCEFLVWGTKGPCDTQGEGPFPGCYEYHVKQSDKYHMAGKPTPLMAELCKIVSEGGIIVDPFAGSGTTCVAAKQMGRQYIGIEKMEEYYKIAGERLGRTPDAQDCRLFAAEKQ